MDGVEGEVGGGGRVKGALVVQAAGWPMWTRSPAGPVPWPRHHRPRPSSSAHPLDSIDSIDPTIPLADVLGRTRFDRLDWSSVAAARLWLHHWARPEATTMPSTTL
jgi:hypothetical protein